MAAACFWPSHRWLRRTSFVSRQGLQPAPWYDLVSVLQYPAIDHGLAMAFGDAFHVDQVQAYPLADFAQRCGIPRGVLKREAARLAKLVAVHAPLQAAVADYVANDERAFAAQLRDFVVGQAQRLQRLATEAADIKGGYF